MDRLEFKSSFTVSDAGEVTGIAWPFGSPDMVGDEILPHAFKSASAPIPMLFGHDQRETVGVWDSITETAKGLEVRGRLLVNDVARAAEVRAMVREKAVTGLSIGFATRKAVARRGGGRTISEVDLMEISIVAVPCHPGARITSAKAAQAGKEGNMPEEHEAALAVITTKMSNLENSVTTLAKLGDRIDGIEAKLNRPSGKADDETADAKAEEKALRTYLRGGVHALDNEDRKTLNLGAGSAGGYVTAPTISTQIIEKLVEINPMRQLASSVAIGTTEIWLPKLGTRLQGNWVTETGSRPSSEPTFEQQKIGVHEYSVVVPVSQQLLDDSFIDLNSYLSAQISTQFAGGEATAFLTGDGNGKPVGLLDDVDAFDGIAAGGNLIEDIIDLFYRLPAAYARNGAWMLNRRTQGAIRKAADASTSRGTIWSDSLANGQPATLLGRPVYDADELDVAGGPSTTGVQAVFGDIAKTYQIVDRIATEIMIDPFTGADNGIVKIRARRRVGGGVVLPEATVLLKSAGAGS